MKPNARQFFLVLVLSSSLAAADTITMKNGAITANNSKIRMIVQNYCNLTLENMTIDAATGTNNASYALSNNCGVTQITGSTTIRFVGRTNTATATANPAGKAQAQPSRARKLK